MNVKTSEDQNEIIFPRVEFVEGLTCIACCFRWDYTCEEVPCGRDAPHRKDGKVGGFKDVSKCH